MGKRDPRIDAYIERSAEFAKPILRHLRKIVHRGCPGVTETVKWQFPHFEHQGVLCSMAAFKQHCAFGFWKGRLVFADATRPSQGEAAMGQFGRITSVKELPSEAKIIAWVKKAVALNEAGVKDPGRSPKRNTKPVKVPTVIVAALSKNATACAAFDAFPPSHRREYVEWIVEAKTDATRDKRIATMLEWLTEGKSLNWKYERAK